MRRNTRLTQALAVALVLATVVACHRKMTVTNRPANVSNAEAVDWYTAADAQKKISDTALNGEQAVEKLNKAGVFKDGEAYAKTLASFGKFAQIGKHIDSVLRQAPENFGASTKGQLAGDFAALATELDSASAEVSVGITNPDSQKEVSTLLAAIKSALSTLQALGGVK